jgi:hypothetical protein
LPAHAYTNKTTAITVARMGNITITNHNRAGGP